RHVSDYLTINEKDPKAHKFLGQIYEAEGDKVKAAGCFKRSLELNGGQKELVLKVAELLSEGRALEDGSAKYWVERAAKVFPGNPVVFSLKEKLLRMGGEPEELEALVRDELRLRPHEPALNVHLTKLLLDSGRHSLVLQHVRSVDASPGLRHALTWQRCVVSSLQLWMQSLACQRVVQACQRVVRLRLLLALHHVVRLSLGTRDIAEAVDALRSFDEELGTALVEEGDWSPVLGELKGQLYLHAGTLLLQMARDRLANWRAVVDQAALCYMLSYQVDRIELKSKSRVVTGQDMDSLSCDRLSQAGHMLVTLREGKPEDYLVQVAESLAGPAGQDALVKAVYAGQPPPCSLLASDDIPQQLRTHVPDMHRLLDYDTGAVAEHGGDLQQLVWLSLMWYDSSEPRPDHLKWLSPLFPKMRLETERLESDSGETTALLDMEVFLLGVTFAANAQLGEKIENLRRADEPRLSPLPLCRLLISDRQRQWWHAVHSLLNRQAQPGTLAKLRLRVQQDLPVLRAHERHGLQPALLIHWADTLVRKGSAQRSKAARRDYVARGAYYWERVLPLLQLARKHKDIPEPIEPLFSHFHSRDIKPQEADAFIVSAKLALGTLSLVREDYEDAVKRFEAVGTPLAFWNCALLFQSLAEDADPGGEETDGPKREQCRASLRKVEGYLLRIMHMLPDHEPTPQQAGVSVSSVRDLLDALRARLEQSRDETNGDLSNGGDLGNSSAAASMRSSASPAKATTLTSPLKSILGSPRTSPRWAQQQTHLLETLCHQVQGLQNVMRGLQMGTPEGAGGVQSRMHMVMEGGYPAETLADSYQAPASFQQGVPLTVSTGGASAFYNQSPGYNTQYLLRTTTPAKHPNMYSGIPRLTPQQQQPPQQPQPPPHVYSYQQPPASTPPAPSSAPRIYPQDVFSGSGYPHGSAYGYDSAVSGSVLSPYGNQFYEPPASNPALPEPGFFTMPPANRVPDAPRAVASPSLQGQPPGQLMQQQQPAFQFSNNFRSDDGDYTFSSPVGRQGPAGSLTTGTPIKMEQLPQTASSHGKPFPPSSSQAGPPLSLSQDTAPYFDVKALSGMSFADLAAQSLDKGVGFGQTTGGTNTFSFKDRGRPLFQQSTPARGDDGSDGEVDSVLGEEDGPHFEPVVPLPDKVEVKTGEEDEEELYCNRAKLFRFDADSKEWKERGVGNFKILCHHVSGKLRVLMRREQVLKICANHYITAEMTLNRNAGSDKSWVWHALDFADEVPRHEQLAIKFKTAEEAVVFRTKFEEAQQLLKNVVSDGDEGDKPLALVKGSSKQSSSKSARAGSQTPVFKLIPVGFGAKFEKKEGEWDCSVCVVRNKPDADACIACLSAKPGGGDRPGQTPAAFAPSGSGSSASFPDFKFSTISARNAVECPGSLALGSVPDFRLASSSSLSFKSTQDNKTPAVASPAVSGKGFGAQFAKKEGQWDCEICVVRNDGSATSCVACQTPNPGAPPFSKKEGEWDCDTCAVRNKPDLAACAACQMRKPDASTSIPRVAESSQASAVRNLTGFGSQFSKKEGEWDCETCAVRNKPHLAACAACQMRKPDASTSIPRVAESSQAPAFGNLMGFGSQFSKKEGEWDCDTCAVRNKPDLAACAACQTRKPGTEPTEKPPAPLTGFGQPSSGFGSSMSGFTFGTLTAKTDESGFSFGSLAPVAGQASAFKFATQEGKERKGPCQPGSASLLLKILAEDHERVEVPNSSGPVGGQGFSGSVLADFKPMSTDGFQGFSGTSFAELATAQPLEFGKNQSSFSNFPSIGKVLFGVTADADTSGQEDSNEMYKTEEDDEIHFEPVVQMPDKVDLVTGEEEEEVCYSQRAKLFRFDTAMSQWKERGVGDIKILRNKQTGRTRILMRREQVLKVCANHCITTSMSLNPMKGSDRAWVWVANDFSEGEPKVEQLAVKFKTPDVGVEFKAKFEECQRALLDMPLQTPHKLLQTGKAAELIQKAEKMKFELKGFKEQFSALDNKSKQAASDGHAVVTSTPTGGTPATLRPGPLSECVVPTLEWDDYDLREGASTCDTSAGTSLLRSPPPQAPDKPDHAASDKPLFRFGETAAGFNFSFQPIVSPGKTPGGHQHRNSTNEENEEEEEEESKEEDNLHFEPIVPLPALIDVRTGEEEEQEVFVHRAKLYRYDREAAQWKERGVGDVKLLQRLEDGRGRLLMRREQVLKICANHWLTADTRLEPMRGSDRAWVWNALDSSDGEPRMEHLALRFKQLETAMVFRQAVLDIQEAQETRQLVPPVQFAPPTPTRVLSVSESAEPAKGTGPAADNEGDAVTEVDEPSSPPRPEMGVGSESTRSPAKSVISPAKFSFGMEALQSLFTSDKPAAGDAGKPVAGFDFSTNKP
uniref:RAN binding protein 2 n=1 Tax=Petromyzon marinus TaxID=7757 RepID=S4RRU4_PETMA